MLKGLAFLVLLMVFSDRLTAQCTTMGQTPSSAFPVCGTTTFHQATVPACRTREVFVPGCSGRGTVYEDLNPFWYRFTCYTSGSFGFTVTPLNSGDDYDWMLYDITGKNPDNVFTDNTMIVTGNWAGTFGATGARAGGANFIQCASNPADNEPSFSAMPNLVAGREYLLLVSHYDFSSQSGYDLSFGGGTAVITDPKEPHLEKGTPTCDNTSVTIKLNKKMRCNSLAADGSDFVLSPATASIVSATGTGCSTNFDMEELVVTFSGALPPGNYTLSMKAGKDNNTVLDNCARGIPAGEQVAFAVTPLQPTLMNTILPVGCAPDTLVLAFDKKIKCSSIAPDGSDFIVTGTTPVTVLSASGKCVNGLTEIIYVRLSAPILTAGNYQIRLVKSLDGNTIIDECSQETPSSSLPFTTADTVNADWTYQLRYGCEKDTLIASHHGRNHVNQWSWNFHNEGSSTQQNPTFVFPSFGDKLVKLVVSNGVCSDSTEQTVSLDNALHAEFSYPEVLCPEDKATFLDKSIGKNIISWKWELGDGSISTQQNPPPKAYPRVTVGKSKIYDVRLIVENNHHCFDTADHKMKLVNSCYIDVPNGFTPNNDGKNDWLFPLNAWKATAMNFSVYNRFGQLVFHTNDWTRQWDGTFNGKPQPTGVFVWILQYTDRETGQKIFKKGSTVLIR